MDLGQIIQIIIILIGLGCAIWVGTSRNSKIANFLEKSGWEDYSSNSQKFAYNLLWWEAFKDFHRVSVSLLFKKNIGETEIWLFEATGEYKSVEDIKRTSSLAGFVIFNLPLEIPDIQIHPRGFFSFIGKALGGEVEIKNKAFAQDYVVTGKLTTRISEFLKPKICTAIKALPLGSFQGNLHRALIIFDDLPSFWPNKAIAQIRAHINAVEKFIGVLNEENKPIIEIL